MSSNTKYLVVISGPTAVGKTKLGIELAKYYSSEIISADSRQFYRELNIGTAKPSEDELNQVKHHFINNKTITELFGAGHFEKEATVVLNELFLKHNLVFLVGGSGMYINALLNGVDEFEEVPAIVREQLNMEAATNGIDKLKDELKVKDLTYYNSVDLNNTQRIIRALEVCRFTGLPYSSFLNKNKSAKNFTPIPLFINSDRETLYQNINTRVDQMMATGLLEEVKSVAEYKNVNALKTVGYKELFDFLEGKTDLNYAVSKIKQHTRNYAKRQITWFNNQDDFETFKPNELEKIKAYIDLIISHD